MNQDVAQKSSLAILPQLSSILEESNHLPLKYAALASVKLVVGRFGKQDLPAALGAARIVSGMEILGADDQILRISALLCLATEVEVLKDMFTPLVPRVFPKSLEYLSQSLQEERKDHRLHNAAYSFIRALLSSTPWILTESYLEQLLAVSYGSASSGLGKECNDIRLNVLRTLAGQVDPQLCFTALDGTWETAMRKGPIVSGSSCRLPRGYFKLTSSCDRLRTSTLEFSALPLNSGRNHRLSNIPTYSLGY